MSHEYNESVPSFHLCVLCYEAKQLWRACCLPIVEAYMKVWPSCFSRRIFLVAMRIWLTINALALFYIIFPNPLDKSEFLGLLLCKMWSGGYFDVNELNRKVLA